MFRPKVVKAQIDAICQAREESGVPPYEMYRGAREMHSVPAGSICFLPDFELKGSSGIPAFKFIKKEPLFIATDDVDQFVLLDPSGDFQIFSLRDDMSCNYAEEPDATGSNDYYILVVHNLNFLFSDSDEKVLLLAQQQQSIAERMKDAVECSQQLADKLAPAKKGLLFL